MEQQINVGSETDLPKNESCLAPTGTNGIVNSNMESSLAPQGPNNTVESGMETSSEPPETNNMVESGMETSPTPTETDNIVESDMERCSAPTETNNMVESGMETSPAPTETNNMVESDLETSSTSPWANGIDSCSAPLASNDKDVSDIQRVSTLSGIEQSLSPSGTNDTVESSIDAGSGLSGIKMSDADTQALSIHVQTNDKSGADTEADTETDTESPSIPVQTNDMSGPDTEVDTEAPPIPVQTNDAVELYGKACEYCKETATFGTLRDVQQQDRTIISEGENVVQVITRIKNQLSGGIQDIGRIKQQLRGAPQLVRRLLCCCKSKDAKDITELSDEEVLTILCSLLYDSDTMERAGKGHSYRLTGDEVEQATSLKYTLTGRFGITDFIFALISIPLFYMDIVSDVLLAQTYYRGNHFWFFALTLAFVIVPSIITCILNLGLFYNEETQGKNTSGDAADQEEGATEILDASGSDTEKDAKTKDKTNVKGRLSMLRWWFRVIMTLLMMGPVARQIEYMYYGIRSRDVKHANDVENIKAVKYYQQGSVLSLFESVLEAGPQLVLQIYVVITFSVERVDLFTDILRATSILTSWISISRSVVSYEKANNLKTLDSLLTTLRKFGEIFCLLWRICEIGCRVIVLCVIATLIKQYMAIPLAIHFLAIFVWVIKQTWNPKCGKVNCCGEHYVCGSPCSRCGRACKCRVRKISNVFLSFVDAFVSIFFYWMIMYDESRPVKISKGRCKLLIMSLVTYTENLVAIGIWFQHTETKNEWFYIPIFLYITAGTLLQTVLMILYYNCCHHHRSKIECCKGWNVKDILSLEAQKGKLEELAIWAKREFHRSQEDRDTTDKPKESDIKT